MPYSPFRANTQVYQGTTFGFSFTIKEDGSALDLTTLSKVEISFFQRNTTVLNDDTDGSLTISGAGNNIVSGTISKSDMDISKRVWYLELRLHYPDGSEEVYAVVDVVVIDEESNQSQGPQDWVLDINNDSETVTGQVTSNLAEALQAKNDAQAIKDSIELGLENVQDLGTISGTTQIDLTNGTVIEATLSGSVTLSFTGLPSAGESYSFTLAFSGAETISYPSGTEFAGGSAPSIIGPDYEIPCSIDPAGTLTVYGVIDEIA